MTYQYCSLPSGNASEFPELDDEIIQRGIVAHFSAFESGGRMYRIAEEEMTKLPHDERGPYLGTDNSGHSMYPIADIEGRLLYFRGSAWQQVQPEEYHVSE